MGRSMPRPYMNSMALKIVSGNVAAWKLLGEGGAIEIVHEDLHERGAMQIWQARNFADHADVAETFDGFAIFAILIADEDDAVDGQFGGMKSGEREQRVIDGADAAARREDYGQHKFHHHVEHELFLIDGDEDAASAFDDEPVVVKAGRQGDAVEVNFGAGPTSCEIGRNGRNEFVNFVESSICADASEAHDGNAIGAFERAGLNRLPVDGIERCAEERRERRFANTGVRAGDEEMIPHEHPAASGMRWVRHDERQLASRSSSVAAMALVSERRRRARF